MSGRMHGTGARAEQAEKRPPWAPSRLSPGTPFPNVAFRRVYKPQRGCAMATDINTPQFAKGLSVRREVLGKDYVDKSLADADDFMMAFQKLTTEWCWGEIWSR